MSSLLSSLLIGVAAIFPALIWYGLHRAATSADFADRRPQASTLSAALLSCWVAAAALLARDGVFHPSSTRLIAVIPNTVVFVALVVALWLVLLSVVPAYRETINRIPQHWLIGAQSFRVAGGLLLVSYGAGKLPAVLALPIGCGELISGVGAGFVAAAWHKRRGAARVVAWLWNAFGIVSLLAAVALIALTTPGTALYRSELGDSSLFSLYPLVLLQVVVGPMVALLHIVSVRGLIRWAPKPRGD